ncbi:hypothetical protein [Bacillus sp. RSS_NA_20]|uniref:hypothetical protein n=1 Tax=Bacillus sp. RSS_NA_20 TaxID=2876777 RepID=UPI001CCF3C5F|nr:hypothetical protein [Bacillus sp. RSS_NA_20]MCA0120913.1 hypothetical protein [Bacillus sp. RSS_NA_20]
MIHTFELNCKISEKKAIKLLTEHYESNETQKLLNELKREKIAIKLPLSIPGIILASITFVGEKYYRIYIRVEPQSLIIGRRTIDVFDCSFGSVERLRTVLDKAIESLTSTLPQSDRWFVSRIDFTKNLTTDYVQECVALAKKGKDPYRYNDTINKPGSSYRASKSVILNFYDKLDHISKKVDPKSFDAHLIEEAHNTFRIEVQCLNFNKLKHLRKKFELPHKSNLYNYLRKDVAEGVIFYYYEKVIGSADYYSLYEALKIVEMSEMSARKKENIKKWLRLVAQAKGVSKAREQFIAGTTLGHAKIAIKGNQNTFRNYENACKKIGINPVTIPKDWGIDYIPNPINSLDTSGRTEIK